MTHIDVSIGYLRIDVDQSGSIRLDTPGLTIALKDVRLLGCIQGESAFSFGLSSWC